MSEREFKLPAVALRGMTVLPSMIIHFDVSRPESIKAVEQALSSDQRVFLVTQRDPQTEKPGREDLYESGTVAAIKNVARLPHNLLRVLVEGKTKAVLKELSELDGALEALVEEPEETLELTDAYRTAMVRGMRDLFQIYARENSRMTPELTRQISQIMDPERLTEQIAINMQLEYPQRQRILEAEDLQERYSVLCDLLGSEIEIGRIRSSIQRKVKERVDKSQKEYYLREQLKVIQEELGESVPMNEADQYKERLDELDAPQEVIEKIRKEINRFRSLGGNTAEASVSRTYIETLLDMPWEKTTVDREDLKYAAQILDEDHYGLEKVKERVLEYLAVRQLTRKGDSPILCLAGPPGTGKTSIARSVARALDKQYIRISLGGVRDEAEIRGHRRTYIGAMPGRIVTGIKNAGVKNPLMLLDEVDKLSSSYNGDPSSALLEVLDSEQNCRFSDHYIEVPVDLSQVLFIATANDLHTVPKPLLDRMEIIEVSSYTENEKLHIAKEHLIRKQKEHHGIEERQLTITDRALTDIIAGYTREAGVRQLERRIGEICRKAARQILEEHVKVVRVRSSNLENYLGKRLYRPERKNDSDDVGIVRGLAWTSVGGVTLQVEVNIMPGRGDFLLTGQMGDVMKESASTAISYVRSVADRYGVEASFFRDHDIHIHIPEGAVPKDGPSAGITMATAILSAITGRKVHSDVAMTGEITLRGRVLPIGGLKEKLLAAQSAKMSTVVVPELNRRDIQDLSGEVTANLKIVYAKSMEKVLETALVVPHRK